MAVALIVAAGRGERLGFGRPKALITLAGRPMVDWSVSALRGVPGVERIVVAMPPEDVESVALPGGTLAVPGGAVRSESVKLALDAAGDGDPVIVHDAARPLADTSLFVRALAELESSGADAAIAAARVTDTIKEVEEDGGTVARTLERGRLWAVQTPQVFRREALERALAEASDSLLAAATDDAWLVERAGGTVRIVASTPENLKVTTLNDLHVAELLLSERASA
jgi:2-C-methyl-D-erythritol 4-phosphate cytidylyltransferase